MLGMKLNALEINPSAFKITMGYFGSELIWEFLSCYTENHATTSTLLNFINFIFKFSFLSAFQKYSLNYQKF